MVPRPVRTPAGCPRLPLLLLLLLLLLPLLPPAAAAVSWRALLQALLAAAPASGPEATETSVGECLV